MSDILCVTNRHLSSENFLTRVEKIAEAGPAGVILREKDLTETEYKELAVQVLSICRAAGIPCILHSFVNAAVELDAEAIHLPLESFCRLSEEEKSHFRLIGVSCHSAEEAKKAEQLGASYITAGHVFDTDCKKGVPGRGLDFLRKICKTAGTPVYAIGGINAGNIGEVRQAGAAGACVMSGLMRCQDPKSYLASLEMTSHGRSGREENNGNR